MGATKNKTFSYRRIIGFDSTRAIATFSLHAKMSKNLSVFLVNLDRKINSNDVDSPPQILRRFGDKTAEVMVRRYDKTSSMKKENLKRRTGKLRASLKASGPFVDRASGFIRVSIARDVPLYAYWQEFGRKKHSMTRYYQVTGETKLKNPIFAGNKIIRTQRGGSVPYRKETSGPFHYQRYRKRHAGKRQPRVTGLKASGKIGTISASKRAKSKDTIIAIDREFYIYSKKSRKQAKLKGTLVARSEKELKRIKRQIGINFQHEGWPGRGFIRAGVLFAKAEGVQYWDSELDKMIQSVAASVKSTR